VSDVGPRGRKEYRVTDAGRAELVRWLINPEEDPPYRSAELLRVFLLAELPRDHACRHMVAVAEQADSEVKRLEALRDSIDWGDDDAAFYGRAVLEYGLRANAMRAEWARSLVKGMEKRARK
jgi:DNA-binding PadR family transcriptional regulator